MPVAQDLQNTVADLSAAIAGRKTYGRVELEALRRHLTAAQRDAGKLERAEHRARAALGAMIEGVVARIADLDGLARHASAQLQPTEARHG